MATVAASSTVLTPGAKTGDPISPRASGFTNGGLEHVTAVQIDESGNAWVANNWSQLFPIVGGDGLPAWTQIVPGKLTRSTIPDFSKVKGMSDIAAGVISWSVRAIRIDDFDYDAFKYNQLSPRFWSHTSVDTFTMQR